MSGPATTAAGLPDRDALRDLAAAEAEPAATITLPTHVRGAEIRQDPIRLKNLLALARTRLSEAYPEADADALLAPAEALVEDYGFWQRGAEGLALFLDEAGMRLHRLPLPLEEAASVGRGFRVAPLLPALSRDGAYRVMTVTDDVARLHDASRFGLAEATPEWLPAALSEVTALDDDYENPLSIGAQGRTRGADPGAASGIAKAQVYGDSPEDHRKNRRVEFLRRIALAYDEHRGTDRRPVVLVADAPSVGHLREFAGDWLAGAVEGNPEAMAPDALREAAYEVVRPLLDAAREEALDLLAARRGRGEATGADDPETVLRAAAEGRVETLLLARDARLPGRFDATSGRVEREDPPAEGQEPAAGAPDLLDEAVRLTLRAGGEVFAVPPERLPGGGPLGALLRY